MSLWWMVVWVSDSKPAAKFPGIYIIFMDKVWVFSHLKQRLVHHFHNYECLDMWEHCGKCQSSKNLYNFPSKTIEFLIMQVDWNQSKTTSIDWFQLSIIIYFSLNSVLEKPFTNKLWLPFVIVHIFACLQWSALHYIPTIFII